MARMEAEVKDEIKFGQLQKYKRPNSHGAIILAKPTPIKIRRLVNN